jgi:hypothetical protein
VCRRKAVSLYNTIFGINPTAPVLLLILGIRDPKIIPRFRDCFLNVDGTEIIIHTRTGGGNRSEYEEQNKGLRQIAGFKSDDDDSFDSTYANFRYNIPEKYKEAVPILLEHGAGIDTSKRWKETFEGIRLHDVSRPEVQKAFEVGKALIERINKLDKGKDR